MSNNFSMYIGIVVEDRSIGSSTIKAYVKELTPFFAGDIADSSIQESYSIKDESGSNTSGIINTSNSIIADYFGVNTNRSFPPDVVKGEQVLIFRYLDNDAYYWISMGRNDRLRRGELLRIAVSDDMAVSKDLTDDNTYFLEIDTKINKRIRIKTSSSDGEAYKYDLTIDAINNLVTLGDNVGNQISIESDVPKVRLVNKDKSLLELNGEDILLFAARNILVRADSKLSIKCGDLELNTNTAIGKIDSGGSSYEIKGNSQNVVHGNRLTSTDGNSHTSVGGTSTSS